MILFRAFLPETVRSLVEASIGAIIVVLALRLLVRWRRGAFHAHFHRHDGQAHLHVHSHARADEHAHAHPLRTPAQAYGIGLVHGMAGSAGITLLIVAAVPSRVLAVVALLVMVAGTTLSMTVLSAAFGRLFGAAAARRAFGRAIPALGFAACVFGFWYAAVALLAV